MAKLAFSKLGVKINTDIKHVEWGDNVIEVRQYLPMAEQAELVSVVLNMSMDDNGYYNPLKIKTYLVLETVFYYTNLTFTEKMKENGLKLYDILISSGLFNAIISAIPVEEWKDLQSTVWHMVSNIYEYKNSAMGILDAITSDYNGLSLDAEALADKVLNPEAMTTLKQLLPLAQ